MPVEFMQYPPLENTGVSGDTLYKMTMAYDGTGRRISKTRWVKARGDAGWSRRHVTHYTGIGTEIRENMPGGTLKDVRVVVNMPVFFRVTLTRLKPRSYIEKDILRLSNGGAIADLLERLESEVRVVPEEPPRKHDAGVRYAVG